MFERPSVAARPLLKWRVLHACLLFALSVPSSIGLAALAPEAQDGSGDHVITANVNLVLLPVTVRDRHGRFVSGLSASNFQVYEDRKLRMITLFRNQDMPVTVGLVVDHSGSMAAKQLEVLEGAQAFVQDSNPQDREFVVNFIADGRNVWGYAGCGHNIRWPDRYPGQKQQTHGKQNA